MHLNAGGKPYACYTVKQSQQAASRQRFLWYFVLDSHGGETETRLNAGGKQYARYLVKQIQQAASQQRFCDILAKLQRIHWRNQA